MANPIGNAIGSHTPQPSSVQATQPPAAPSGQRWSSDTCGAAGGVAGWSGPAVDSSSRGGVGGNGVAGGSSGNVDGADCGAAGSIDGDGCDHSVQPSSV